MIEIDPEDITKVLDIDWSQVKHLNRGLTNRLAGFEEYVDQGKIKEHMYPVTIFEKMDEYNLIPLPDLKEILQEIIELCGKHDCAYFRIINPPVKKQGFR